MTTALNILFLVSSIGMIALVLLQSGRSAGLSGSIAGGAQSLFGKKKGVDDFLAKITVVVAVVFMVLAIVLASLGV
ncbi:MAG: preprotein translocase subunit SecG [Dethiobacter sp.]|nr:preprotein translocase subunit SecG [Dethiobacter sp.]